MQLQQGKCLYECAALKCSAEQQCQISARAPDGCADVYEQMSNGHHCPSSQHLQEPQLVLGKSTHIFKDIYLLQETFHKFHSHLVSRPSHMNK